MNRIKKIYLKLFPSFEYELEKELEGCESFLDLACGVDTPIKNYSKKYYSLGVDIFEPSIKASREKRLHSDYIKMNVLDIGKRFSPKSFDCVVAIDLIEHLEKKDGLYLISSMEKIAKKKVIIFTPNGFLKQEGHSGNKWQAHLSGWGSEEIKKKGYFITGIGGYKKIKGEYAKIKYKPYIFWRILSDLSQKIWTKRNPKKAFAILCVKHIS